MVPLSVSILTTVIMLKWFAFENSSLTRNRTWWSALTDTWERSQFYHIKYSCCFQQFIFILNSTELKKNIYKCIYTLFLLGDGFTGYDWDERHWERRKCPCTKRVQLKLYQYSCDKLLNPELSAVKFYMPELTCQSASSHMVLIWRHSTDASRMWEVSGSFPLIFLSTMLPVHTHAHMHVHAHAHTDT